MERDTAVRSPYLKIMDQDTDDWLLLASVYAAKANSENRSLSGKIPKEKYYEKTINSIQAQLAFRKGNYQQALTYLKSSTDTVLLQIQYALVAYIMPVICRSLEHYRKTPDQC